MKNNDLIKFFEGFLDRQSKVKSIRVKKHTDKFAENLEILLGRFNYLRKQNKFLLSELSKKEENS